MLRLLLIVGLLLTNALTIGPVGNNTTSSSPSLSISASPSVSPSIYPSTSSIPLPSTSSIPPANTPTNNSMLGYIMVGSTLGVLMIAGISVGIHAIVKRRSENVRLVSTANRENTVNTRKKTKQVSIATILPSQKILNYKDDTDNRIAFPPV